MINKEQILTLNYVYRGMPFCPWVKDDVDTGNLDYVSLGVPYNASLEESTILVELSGSIAGVSSISADLFVNTFAELAGAIDAVSGLSATLGVDIALSGSIEAVSAISEAAFLGLDVHGNFVFSLVDQFGKNINYELEDIPVDPEPKFWKPIVTPSTPGWTPTTDASSFWRPIIPKDQMEWSEGAKASQFWRTILQKKTQTWIRGQDAEQISDT